MQYTNTVGREECTKMIQALTAAIGLLTADGSAKGIAHAATLADAMVDFVSLYAMFDD